MGKQLFIDAAQGHQTKRPPVWVMRQAGRYLPEYREIRAKNTFLEVCHNPELATEVTLQPLDRFGMDGAILFSDILIPFHALEVDIEFNPSPKIANPVKNAADINRLGNIPIKEAAPFVFETLKRLRPEVDKRDTALIGFAGAPFTMATYIIEGGPSKNYQDTKMLMYQDPKAFHLLMERLTSVTIDYLNAQIDAGADVVQLFDTWAGILSPEDFKEFVAPYVKQILDALKGRCPRIYFAKDGGTFLEQTRDFGADVLGVDWRLNIGKARGLVGEHGLQGNMDPLKMFGPKEMIEAEVQRIATQAKGGGHIFNLGHGILPQTPIESMTTLINAVKAL